MHRVAVAVFAYNRPLHLARCLTALLACPEAADCAITVFCDGARDESKRKGVAESARLARQFLGERADIRVSRFNKGLASSIIDGVSELVNRHGRVIVIEDDLVVCSNFLTYMLAGLDRYEGNDRVYQISGHQFRVPEFSNRQDAMLLPIATTWGWATWARAWKCFDLKATGWEKLLQDEQLRTRFNLDGVYDYSSMLELQMKGRRDSWGIRWYWSIFRRNGLCVFPPQTLVRNIGTDGSGTHGRGWIGRIADIGQTDCVARSIYFPKSDVMHESDFTFVKNAILRQSGGATKRLLDRLRRVVRM